MAETCLRLYEALLFDMDGLLLDTERLFMEALVKVAAPFGYDDAAVRAFFLTLIGTSAEKTTAALADFVPAGVDVAAFDRTWREANRTQRQGPVPLRPQVGQVIPALAQAGHRMAVVTSTKRAPAVEHLQSAGLLHHFELVVAGDEVAANKPDPAPYLQAARTLGVDPARCAAFEDSDTGTQAAVAAGCVTTQIPDLRPDVPLPQLGQRVAHDLGQAVHNLGLMPHPA
ncbi:HAD family hydrolase [Pseudooctadecabacter jejudonensis]|uniref:Fructose-1-phosphate phosphatase YqaB n=1 Tax=Pseudooctadecabacter jejudonensis TaxID=1391910 RepID=A0A1Y5R7K4_9RHOB|nr:HAD family phosphatase [Pseudooctadecabacter jejudonensis]SLN11010.1 Fructose-1-phosphate phosphatase YqaB [Pseudooctadecabacter jejudonensis]